MKRSVILTDRLGPDILSAFWTKGQVLHCERAHLKVPGWLLNCFECAVTTSRGTVVLVFYLRMCTLPGT